MVGYETFMVEFNEVHERLLRAAGDPAVSADTVREWQRRGLRVVADYYETAWHPRYADLTFHRLDHEITLDSAALVAIIRRTGQTSIDRSVTREEVATRLASLRSKCRHAMQVVPADIAQLRTAFGHSLYQDEFEFIDRMSRQLNGRSRSTGCSGWLFLILFVIAFVVVLSGG
jgi:hypothetical protein